MEETVSAADANRRFSEILRKVRAGRTVIVTSHGAPVARIVPAQRDERLASAAKGRLITRLRSRPVQVIGHRWRREDLYEG